MFPVYSHVIQDTGPNSEPVLPEYGNNPVHQVNGIERTTHLESTFFTTSSQAGGAELRDTAVFPQVRPLLQQYHILNLMSGNVNKRHLLCFRDDN